MRKNVQLQKSSCTGILLRELYSNILFVHPAKCNIKEEKIV